ncbi:RNA polymerase sigma factor [Roseateles sp. NT4]|uniref:RNA polymerase sigma factor n=1 Tax=Roseateles sp. NT4 TaxID=3453715 RepID=UPI003EEB9D41
MTTNWRAAFSRIRAALVRRGRSEQDADDFVQEAWVRLACYEQDRTVQKPEAFLMRAALNLSIDAHRSRSTRGEELVLDEVVIIDAAPGAEDVLLARERMARLGVCLGRLSEKTREIFLAHRVDGATYQQIARSRGISISTVEKHVAKAMLQLSTWMEGW